MRLIIVLLMLNIYMVSAEENKHEIFVKINKWILEYSIKNNIYNPTDFVVTSNTLIILDKAGDYPLKLFLTKDGSFVKNIARKGQGPSEIEIHGPVSIIKYNNLIYVYGSNKILKIYEKSPEGYKYMDYIIPNNLYYEFCVSDSFLIFRGGIKQDYLFYIYKKSYKNNNLGENILHAVNFDDNKYLENCKYNPLINQGKIYCYNNKIICYFDYSTILVVYDLNKEQVKYILEPEKILLPNAEKKSKKRLIAPDATKYKQTYLDITSDDNYIYLLYSGFKPSLISFLSNSYKLFQGNLVRIFDKNTFKYIASFKLPEYAKRIKIYNNHLYLLSTQNGPHLSKYKFQILLKDKVF